MHCHSNTRNPVTFIPARRYCVNFLVSMRKHVNPNAHPLVSTAQLPKATLSGILPRKLELAHLLMGQSNALYTNFLSSSLSESATATGIALEAHDSGEGRIYCLTDLEEGPLLVGTSYQWIFRLFPLTVFPYWIAAETRKTVRAT